MENKCQHIVVYDFETYWTKDYSLSKMSPIDYVRDSRFYAQLLAVSVDGKAPIVVEHDDIPQCLELMGLTNPQVLLIGHNSSGFDNLILSEVYGIQPKCMLSDTIHLARWAGVGSVYKCSLADLAIAFGIGKKGTGTVTSLGKRTKEDFTPEDWESFKAYCKKDVQLTLQLAAILLPIVPKEALLFSDISSKMATQPMFCVNTDILQQYLHELIQKETEARQSLITLLGMPEVDFLKTIRSAKKFEAILRLLNIEVPMKVSAKKTATARKLDPDAPEVLVPALAKTDLEFLALQEHPNPQVRELVRLRLEHNSSVPMTRTKALLHMAEYKKPIPVLLKCFHAHTSRYGAGSIEGKSDSLNWQNFAKHNPQMKPMRKSIIPPPGYVIVACDSSQVEARCVAYEAQQRDLLQQFAEHRDPYAELAAKFDTKYTAQQIHDGAKSGDVELKKLRNAAKRGILSGGYGASSKRYADSIWNDGVRLAEDKDVHDKLAAPLHAIYRANNSFIVTFWKTCRYVLEDLITGGKGVFGGPNNDLFEYGNMPLITGDSVPSIKLPSGFILRYPNLRWYEFDGKKGMAYDRWLGKNKVPTRIYGAALTENCIAEDTKILTDTGWKPIQNIKTSDLVYDGIEFVRHDGIIHKGKQTCICLEGVWLTPDHKVLVDGKQNLVRAFRKDAPQFQRHYRTNFWEVDSDTKTIFSQRQMGMGISLRMRSSSRTANCESDQVYSRGLYSYVPCLSTESSERATSYSWFGKYADIQRLAFNAIALRNTYISYVSSLWRAWYKGMRSVAQIREFLQRYVFYIPTWFSIRSDRQQWRLLSGELSLDYLQRECEKQRKYIRGNRFTTFIKAIRNKCIDFIIPSTTWMAAGSFIRSSEFQNKRVNESARIQKEVFDIRNCGPRQRFVVQSNVNNFICHNCTQALAFQVLIYQADLMRNRGLTLHCNIHDSFASVVPEDLAEQTKSIMLECMTTVPPWCPGLPIDAEAEVGHDFTIV